MTPEEWLAERQSYGGDEQVMADALLAVLNLHQRFSARKPVCTGCSVPYTLPWIEEGEDEPTSVLAATEYPCPTREAILEALDLKEN